MVFVLFQIKNNQHVQQLHVFLRFFFKMKNEDTSNGGEKWYVAEMSDRVL